MSIQDFNIIHEDNNNIDDWFYINSALAVGIDNIYAMIGVKVMGNRWFIEHLRKWFDIMPVMNGKKVTAYIYNDNWNKTTKTFKADWS